jgi:hypothetical protein
MQNLNIKDFWKVRKVEMLEAKKWIEEILKRRKEEQEIKCPHCGAIQPNDNYQYPVTYWNDLLKLEA